MTLGQLTRVQPQFNTVDAQNQALRQATGLTVHELVAEAVAHERQQMLAGGDSRQYIRLLTTLFGKFSIGAPQAIEIQEPQETLTREEIRARIDNYMTRIRLSEQPTSSDTTSTRGT